MHGRVRVGEQREIAAFDSKENANERTVWISVAHATISETRGDSNDTDTGTDTMMGNSSDKNDRSKLYGGTGRGTRMGYYG